MLYYSHFVIASSVTTFRFLTDIQLLYLMRSIISLIIIRSIMNLSITALAIMISPISNPSILNLSIMSPSILLRRPYRSRSIKIISPLSSRL